VVPLAAQGEYELTWSLPNGVRELRAELDGGDSQPADDRAYVSIHPARPIETLLVSARPAVLQRALAAIPGVRVTTLDPSAYSATQPISATLTIFDGVLPSAWPAGATLAINPPRDATLLGVAAQDRPVASDQLLVRGSLLEGLSFSGVRFGRVLPVTAPDWAQVLLGVRSEVLGSDRIPVPSEIPLVLRGRVETHEIAIWGFDLAGGNLPARLAFPLLVSRTVRDLTAGTPPAAIESGQPAMLRPDPRAQSLVLTAPDGAEVRYGAAAGGAIDGLDQAGFYTLEERAGDQVLYRGSIGVNAGSLSESRIAPQSAPPISGTDRDDGGGPLRRPLDLWPWIAGAALLLLVSEWLFVLRR
jgi:hypothetical protein